MTFPDLSGEAIDLGGKGIRVKLKDQAGYFKVLEVALPDLSENDQATALLTPLLGKEVKEVPLRHIRSKYLDKLAREVPYYNLPDQEFFPFLVMPDGRGGIELITRIKDNYIYRVDKFNEVSYSTIEACDRWYFWFRQVLEKSQNL